MSAAGAHSGYMTTTATARSAGRLRDRAAGLASRVVGGLATPLVGADYLDLVAPLRRGARVRAAKVLAVRQETRDAVTLVLRPGRDWAGHTPGQHVRVGVEVDGVRLWRTYSITSAPVRGDERGAHLSITTKLVPGGAVSTHLTRHTQVGDLVHLGEAEGDFTINPLNPRDLLFVTGGSGITPVMGMLRSGVALGDVVVVHSARTVEDVVFGLELRDLARLGRITLIERHTADDGRLTLADLVELVPDAADREVYACGPAGLVETVRQGWVAMGRTEHLHTEIFHSPVAVAGSGGTAVFESSGVTVAVEPGTSLLQAGEDAGVTLPFGCRQGLCFRCVRPLVEGTVQDLRTGDLTHAAEGDGVSIQTCVSTAAGHCRIDG